MIRWAGIRADDVQRWQNIVRPFIDMALERSNGDYSADDIFRACRQGTNQLWLVHEDDRVIAAVVTAITETPRQKRCVICQLGGSRIMDWLNFLGVLEAWAKAQGCVSLDIPTRPGMQKLLSDYQRHAIILRKML